MTDFNLIQLIKRPHYALLGLIAGLFSLYLALIWRVGKLTHLGISGLFMLVALTLLWENYSTYRYKHDRLASTVAIGLLCWIFWQSTVIVNEQQIQLQWFPFIAALAVALLASGFQGLYQYRRELAIMFSLGIPSAAMSFVDISAMTADMASFLLSSAGFDVTQQGAFIYLPIGATRVHVGCSGMGTMAYLLGIAVIWLSLYPIAFSKKILALLGAPLIGFMVNSVRVALMATLSNPATQKAFAYWYEGDGALFFGVVAIVLFAGFYHLLHQIERWQRRNLEAN